MMDAEYLSETSVNTCMTEQCHVSEETVRNSATSDIHISQHNARAAQLQTFVSQLVTLPSAFDYRPRNENVWRSGRAVPRVLVFRTWCK
jgi:hypothetical protein